MSEIKSTLDLVMERTKNMVLSKDEKQNQEIETAKKQFNGALQKHLDDLMTLKDLRQSLEDLRQKYPDMDSGALRSVLLERVGLEALQGPLPDLLRTLFGGRIEGLKRLGQQYTDKIQSEAEQHMDRVRMEYGQKHQIAGSAMLPNIEADPQWTQKKNIIVAAYEQRLEEEKAAIYN